MSTYVATSGRVDLFATSLFVLALFVLSLFAGKLQHLPRCCPFRVSWWAVSFPLAAASIAALRIAAAKPGWATQSLAGVLLALSTVVILYLLGRTAMGLVRGELQTLTEGGFSHAFSPGGRDLDLWRISPQHL